MGIIKRNRNDGYVPNINSIRQEYGNGDYGHEVESIVGVLLKRIEYLESRLEIADRETDKWIKKAVNAQ
jgi:hypothetical protein